MANSFPVFYSRSDGIWKIGAFESCIPAEESEREGFQNIILTRNPSYDPPESVLKKYTTSWDIWQAGCILYELATRKPLIGDTQQLHEFTRKFLEEKEQIKLSVWFPFARYAFGSSKLFFIGRLVIMQMLDPVAEGRPTAGNLVHMFTKICVYGTDGEPFLAEAPHSPPL
jgi:serine/threonine protein kinase